MKNLNLQIVAGYLCSAVLLNGCVSYSPEQIKSHRDKVTNLSKNYQSTPVVKPKQIVEHETELFSRKVSLVLFNQSLESVLPTLIGEVNYSKGINTNDLVSLEVTNLPVSQALHRILKPIGLSYIRTTGGILIIKQKRITFRAFSQPLDIVLNSMLGDISYIVRDGAEKSLKELVSVEFEDLPIELALDRLLAQLNISWKKEAKSYVIFRDKEQLFSVNFPLIEQSFDVSSSREALDINKQKEEQSSGGISFSSSKATSSSRTDSLSNLTQTIEKFLTDTGRVIIHKELGMIWVQDRADVVDRIGNFLSSVNKSLSTSVSINGVITEVDLNEGDQFGIDWTLAADNLVRAGASIASTGSVLGGANGSNFTLAWKDGSGSVTKSYINALKQFGDVKVISRPSIRVANNAIGSLIVGRNISYVAEVEAVSSSSDTTRFASKLRSLQTGLNFYVLPHIISDTQAVLYISPELTSLEELRLISSSGTGSPNVEAPTITMRQTQTVIPIRNGESLIIGGLMSETDRSRVSDTPVLGDIPILGGLFQTKNKSSGVSEFSLMVNVSW